MPNVLLTFNDLSTGEIVANQFAAEGVTISSSNGYTPVMIFDTDNPTGGDDDLAADGFGNVLILSEDGDSSDPDDNANGGTFIFDFDEPSEIVSFNVLDIEEGGTVRLFDENGTLIAKLPLTTVGDGQSGIMNVGFDNVARMEVTLNGSGAIDNLSFVTPQPVVPDGIVEGTNDDDLIDLAYLGDPDGDRIDNNDAILPGEAAQDDIVHAFDGDDTIKSGAGNDEVFAGSGDDTVFGGAGDDEIFGEDGNDTISGGAGADALSGGDGRDTFVGGNDGDTVDGGAGGKDFDILDLTGEGRFEVINETTDANGNGTNGTVNFLTDDNEVTGTLEFTEIEQILGDRVEIDRDTPVAVDDKDTTDEDTSLVIDVLANDTDPNGDTLSVISAAAENGTVVINDDGTLTYTPDANFNGDDTISYVISDPDGNTDTGEVALTVAPINDDPDARDDTATTPFNTAVVIPVLANDIDVDGDALSITTATSEDGSVTINGDGTVTFTPNTGFTGDAEISYSVTDNNGGVDTAIATVTVGSSNPDGIVNGTDGDDLINLDYLGDPEGDRIDNNDAIFNGEAPQDDIVLAGAGDDVVFAGLGDDDVFGEDGDDTLFGESGDDLLDGGAGDDILDGGIGNDTLIGSDGNDTANGGDGDDIIDTSGTDPLPDLGYPGLFPADVDPFDDRDVVDGGAGNDTITTGDDQDQIFGGTGDDTINAGIDDDTVFGEDGDDRIVGGEGNDTISGGAGDDTIFAGIDPDLGLPDNLDIQDDGTGPFGPDLVPNNGQDVVSGGDGNDTIFGADDDDILSGDAGDDFIDGGFDDDIIDGGTGNDTIIGGQGVDDLSGGDDRDTFIVSSGDEAVGDVIDGGSGGDDFDTLDLTGSGPFNVTFTSADQEDGFVDFLEDDGSIKGTLQFTEIENVVPCFTPGTAIATARGEVLVEALKVGDKVITRDNGIQEIRWVGTKQINGHTLFSEPHLQPVLVQAGSLGNNLPERDITVSPNHRMLVNNDRVSLYFEENEVLVSAKHLVNPSKGVQAIQSMGVTYIHFMFDAHEVVLANGAWTESFQPGDYSLNGIGNSQRNEIFELFPELNGKQGLDAYSSARLTLKKHEARMLFK